jgi:hypothetical protein
VPGLFKVKPAARAAMVAAARGGSARAMAKLTAMDYVVAPSSGDNVLAADAKHAIESLLESLEGGGEVARHALQLQLEELAGVYADAVVRALAVGEAMPPPGTHTEADSLFEALRANDGALAPVKLLRASSP